MEIKYDKHFLELYLELVESSQTEDAIQRAIDSITKEADERGFGDPGYRLC